MKIILTKNNKKMNAFINKETISNIWVYDKKVNFRYSYSEGGFLNKKGFYYRDSMGREFESLLPPKDKITINNVVYNKPIVTIYYDNGSDDSFEFETYEEAKQWADVNFNDKGLIKLTRTTKK